MTSRWRPFATRRLAVMALILVLPQFAAGPDAADAPLLSEEIRRSLEDHGAAAAEQRFREIVPERQHEYRLDLEGRSLLGAELMQRGDMATAQILFAMVATLFDQTHAAALERYAPEPVAEPPAPWPVEPVVVLRDYGPPRTDLARFVGVYGDPARQERTARNFFVDETCDGRLRFGAMWGDVAPWVMRSQSDTGFEQAVLQPGQAPIRLEFQVGADGRAERLTHSLPERTTVSRLGDLPEYFERECGE